MLVKKGDQFTCKECGNEQIISNENIYQDISGKAIMCEKCHTLKSVEVEKE